MRRVAGYGTLSTGRSFVSILLIGAACDSVVDFELVCVSVAVGEEDSWAAAPGGPPFAALLGMA